MRIVTIIKVSNHQVVYLPDDMAYENVEKLEITRDGDVITLRPARPSWPSLSDVPKVDSDFLQERPVIVERQHQRDLRKKLRGSVIKYVDPFQPVDE
ncbi:AbrB family transcriptional regulator [Halomonas sp. TRM85114]|uniref:AbrB family transcriptional regulator n=1 Tax=Halomonas jincaotanensis TaxID=2810616 RepID=UPI001BD445DD|nr:AbrB family transcriptional regulator [Halomonas jincaotanensis]MBS9405628.1 AbrB family transcriptional regulator [Halomonas jincaotanensis]